VTKDKKGNFYYIGWKRVDIVGMLQNHSGRTTQRNIILREKNRGNELLNENIPEELILREV